MTANEMVKILVDEKKRLLIKYENKVNEVKKLQELNRELSLKCASLSNLQIEDNDSIEYFELEESIAENNRLNKIISELESDNKNIVAELEESKKEIERLNEVINTFESSKSKKPKRKNKDTE